VTRSLAPALLAFTALLQVACGQPRPPEEGKAPPRVLTIPPAPPSTSPAPEREAHLRLTARLGGYPPRFFPAAGLVHPCPTQHWACRLEADGSVTPANDYARFANEVDAFGGRIIHHHGSWPQRAWMAARLGPFAGDPEMLDAFLEWTDAGWTRKLEYEGYVHVGMGPWVGDRLIAPIVYVEIVSDSQTGDSIRKFIEPPKFVILSGPPSNDLPLLTPDPTFEPQVFASLPSGHAFLAGDRLEKDGRETYVQRWTPGDRRSKEDLLKGFFMPMETSGLERVDPAKIMLAFAPDDVYIAGSFSPSEGELNAAFAHYNGRAWNVSSLPTSLYASTRKVMTMARGPDGVMWFVCGDSSRPAGELWKKAPLGGLERVDLPEAHADGGPIEVVPLDVWPRKEREIWLIAAYRPRGATKHTTYTHGVFLLEPSARGAAPR